MKKGIVLPQHDVEPSVTLRAAELAEDAGLDSAWLIDHLHGRPDPRRPILELGAMLGALALSTDWVTIGPLVLRIGLRLPGVIAAIVRTTDMIAAGRLTVALGLSDTSNASEQSAYGLPLEPRPQRLEVMHQTIAALREEAPNVAIWIGGAGDDLLGIAQSVDGWNFWGKVADMKAPLDRLRAVDFQGEVSWAGSWPTDDDWEALGAMRVDHVIVATGRDNYRQRIGQLSDKV